jgi:hypothetical protein
MSVSKLLLKCAVVSLYSVVKQRFKCNAGEVGKLFNSVLLTKVRGNYFQNVCKCTATFRTHCIIYNIIALF